MNVASLIEKLSGMDPDLEVFLEVDGGSRRTGDFMHLDGFEFASLQATTYGGYNYATDDPKTAEFRSGDPVEAVVLT